jgi:hypothetical protein
MKRKLFILFLSLSAGVTIIAMLALCSTSTPAFAQATPTYWMECSTWTSYTLPASGMSTDYWGTADESYQGYNTVDRIPYSTTIKGVYVAMQNFTATLGDFDVRYSGVLTRWYVYNGEIVSTEGCADSDDAACAAMGYSRDGDLDESAGEDGWLDDSGLYDWSSNASFSAHVCAIYFSVQAPSPSPTPIPVNLDLNVGDLMVHSGELFNSLLIVFVVVTGWSIALWLVSMLVNGIKSIFDGMR